MATDNPEIPLSLDEEPCLECPHDLTAHSRRLGCWLCDCTFGRTRPAADGQGDDEHAADSRRYVQAWFLFVGPDGELTKARDAARISIGATRAGRVRVTVPEGLDIAPGLADHVARRITEAAVEARARGKLARDAAGWDGVMVRALPSGLVEVTTPPGGPGMAPWAGDAVAAMLRQAAHVARERPPAPVACDAGLHAPQGLSGPPAGPVMDLAGELRGYPFPVCPECGNWSVIYSRQLSADYCVVCGWDNEDQSGEDDPPGPSAASPAGTGPSGLSWVRAARTLARLRAAVTCAGRGG